MKRIGFIGTGWTDVGQIKAFKAAGLIPQAIYSRNLNKAKTIASKYGIPEIYTDWKKLIQSSSIDIISIVVPTWLHAEMIEYAQSLKKHYICEAPFLSTEEIRNLIDKRNDSVLEIIDYELRYTPHFKKIKELISTNEIGKIKSFKFIYEKDLALNGDNQWDWTNDLKLGGGYFNIVGGHFVDLSKWLFGEIKQIIDSDFKISSKQRVYKNGISKKVTADDYANIHIKFENEVIGQILVSQMSSIKNELCFTIIGENGILKLDLKNNLYLKMEEEILFKKIIIKDETDKLFNSFDNNLFTIGTFYLGKKMIEYFNNTSLKFPNLEDALNNQKVIEQAYKHCLTPCIKHS